MRLQWLSLGLTAASLVSLLAAPPARAQGPYPPGGFAVGGAPRGSYGPRGSFGEFGYKMNVGEAFGNPYGGLAGRPGYGFGYGVGPGFGPNGAAIYSSAYVAPGANSRFSGYYPPFAAYGNGVQNPAVFPPGSLGRPGWRPRLSPPGPVMTTPRPYPVFVPGPR